MHKSLAPLQQCSIDIPDSAPKVPHKGVCGGINGAAYSATLLPMSTSARAMLWAHCGCFCQLLNKQWVSGSMGSPNPSTTTYPLIYDTHDIKVLKSSKPAMYVN